MSKKVTLIVDEAIEKSTRIIEAIPPSKLLQRTNADRIVIICKDLVISRPSQDPLSPKVTELGRIRYGKFPAEQTLLNHYRSILRVWRDAFQKVVSASAPVATKHGNGLAIADEELLGLDSGTKARVQIVLAALREAKLENDRLKRLIRDNIPAPGHATAHVVSAAVSPDDARAVKEWLASLDAGTGALDIEATGLRISRRGRPGAIVMSSEVLTVARHDGWPASDSRMAGRCASLGWPD